MKNRFTRIMILAMALVLSAATAAAAVDQTVEVDVQPFDALGIQVDGHVWLSVELGETTPWQEFNMQILNTTSAGWQVTATSTDLLGYYQECDEFGENCVDVPTGGSIPASALELWGQDQADYTPGAVTGFDAGTLDNATAHLLLEGTPEMQGWFGIQNPPTSLRLTAPASNPPTTDVLLGQMRATITYTIITYTPPA